MNKNIVKFLAVLVMCFMITAVLVACQGEPGAPGAEGVKGDKGDQGEPGTPGADGKDGKDGIGIDNVVINDKGELVITYTDGKEVNLGVVKGEDGKDGENGEDAFVCDHVDHWDSYELNPHTIDKAGVTLYVCEVCGFAKFGYDNHAFNQAVVTTIPTVDADGEVTITCSCGATVVAPIPSLSNSKFYMVELGNCVTPDKYHFNLFDAEQYIDVSAYFELPSTTHSFTEFSEESIADGSWKLVIPAEAECPCTADKLYYPVCQNGCGTDFNQVDFPEYVQKIEAPGHVFDLENGWHEAEKKPGESPCMQDTVYVNECLNCYDNNSPLHLDCVLTRVETEAPGHTWGPWTVVTAPTADTKGEAMRVCTVCELAEYGSQVVIDELELPALNTEDYAYDVTLAPTCVDTGKATYTYTCEDGTTIVIEAVLDPNGHAFSAESEYTCKVESVLNGDVITHTPTVSIKCDDCDYNEVIVLPVACTENIITGEKIIGAGYLVQYGHCYQKHDVYTFAISGFDVPALGLGENESFVVEFEIEVGYEHDGAPADSELVLVEGTEKNYYVYKCSKCGDWIVAKYENKNP